MVRTVVCLLMVAASSSNLAWGTDGIGSDKPGDASRAEQAEAFRKQAESFVDDKDFARAIAFATDAVQLEPKNTENFVLRGGCWFLAENVEQAIVDINEALRLDATNAAALSLRDTIRVIRSSDALLAEAPEEALRLATDAIHIDPSRAKSYSQRASFFCDAKAYDQAIADLAEAIRLDPGNAEYYRRRGRAWKRKGDSKRAKGDFNHGIRLATEAIQKNPDDVPALASRARLFDTTGEYDRAIADYDEVLRVEPDNADIKEYRRWSIDNKETHTLLEEIESADDAAP
jgi:tetratricopeptide (TPR) repeat protein